MLVAPRGVIGSALLALVLALSGCSASVVKGNGMAASASVAATSVGNIASPTLPASATVPAPSSALAVHVTSLESDGGIYGVGMPIVFYFNQKITSVKAFDQTATVTVNGAPAMGAWFFEVSSRAGQIIEAHYRPETFWPGHAKIFVNAAVRGLIDGTHAARQKVDELYQPA